MKNITKLIILIYIIAIATQVIGCLPNTSEYENLLTNSDFEHALMEPFYAAGAAEIFASEVYYEGKQSCKVVTEGWGAVAYDITSILTEKGDGFYHFSAYVRGHSEDVPVYLYLSILYESGLKDNFLLTGSTKKEHPNAMADAWRLLSGSVALELVEPVKSANIMLINNEENQSFYLDEAALTYRRNETDYDDALDGADESDPLKRLPGLLIEADTTSLPEIINGNMAHLKGVNLTNFFSFNAKKGTDSNYLPQEHEFCMLSELGFNFVRIPFDYAFFVDDFTNKEFVPDKLQMLDEMILYGRKYNVHIMLNMHSAPGCSLTRSSQEGTDRLWTQISEQEAFIRQWETLALRYKGIPSRELSFNLLNEPNSAEYANLARETINAIRRHDTERLIVSDNIHYQVTPLFALRDEGVVAAARGYFPTFISHYKASWIADSELFPPPVWPAVMIPGRLYTPTRASQGLSGPLQICFESPPAVDYRLGIRVQQVSTSVTLQIKADDRVMRSWSTVCTDGEGEWKEAVYNRQYDIYINRFDLMIYADIPAHTETISIEAISGDWLSFNEVVIEPVDAVQADTAVNELVCYRIPALAGSWGEKVSDISLDLKGRVLTGSRDTYDKARLKEYYQPSLSYEESGGGVFIGEMGVFHTVSHQVALDYMKDLLEIYDEFGWGWALWNFRGGFGVMDSERLGAEYVDFHGHHLDRKMMDLIHPFLEDSSK